ncbi:MAG: DEAD/DEAH box helicase [Fibrobacteres bacterium]|nr:DEAD/DEAH box helicase [Fibrobacterota bacterium]
MIYVYNGVQRALLREVMDFGISSCDLVAPPQRIGVIVDSQVSTSIDRRRLQKVPGAAEIIEGKAQIGSVHACSARTLGRIHAAFLVAEDPQRRLDVMKAATLMHQASLVQHIMDHPSLRKVLIGDEVGLGKTIEAGLIIRRILQNDPRARVLYLAPARLVSNVVHEFRTKLDLDARKWVASGMDARIATDRLVVASLQKAVFGENRQTVLASGSWDAIFVDECHHLSDWDQEGGGANRSFRLVQELASQLGPEARLVLMSGTPHQGNQNRFRNLLRLLSEDPPNLEGARGKVIFRTKDRVRDWKGRPLFPRRDVRPPRIVDLGGEYGSWYDDVAGLYDTISERSRTRATGWAKGQALQWAASSLEAGLGYLVRLAMRRLKWNLEVPDFAQALEVLRPYRGGAKNEPLPELYQRLCKQIGISGYDVPELDEEELEETDFWIPDPEYLRRLLREAVSLVRQGVSREKWSKLAELIDEAQGEKIVLFAQPVETVTVVAEFLRERYGKDVAVIIGNQSDDERMAEVDSFQSPLGPQFLVSSRAGGEGLNMQAARRLIHLDVPWNPMDMEQRVGRVHRFGSQKTIIVETLVAAGSREIDMYMAARSKLDLIAAQLDPDHKEELFMRVMSLVPPQELESIISNAPPGPLSTADVEAIGRLVQSGYDNWKSFDERYRESDEQIRALNPGAAGWSDLGAFLVAQGDAQLAEGVDLATFLFRDGEIEASTEEMPSVRFQNKLYALGDTSGIGARTSDGQRAESVGLNLPEVQQLLKEKFLPSEACGAAVVRTPEILKDLVPPGSQAWFFLRQHVKNGQEIKATFHAFVTAGKDPVILDTEKSSLLVRSIMNAQKVRTGKDAGFDGLSIDLEKQLYLSLMRPTDEELSEGIRYAVWSLGGVIFR